MNKLATIFYLEEVPGCRSSINTGPPTERSNLAFWRLINDFLLNLFGIFDPQFSSFHGQNNLDERPSLKCF